MPVLAYDHDLYFDADGADRVRLELLVAMKAPENQPGSVQTALERMQQAADGLIPRRGPITVHRRADGRFDILDGNATYGAALCSGWPDLPVVLDDLLDVPLSRTASAR